MSPMECPKFATCSAPVCPLHDRWRTSSHLRGESVCLWLRELQKNGGAQRLSALLRPDMVLAVCECHEALFSGSGALPVGAGEMRRKLAEAATSGSKLRAGQALQEKA